MKCYRNITTDEVVYEEDAEYYALTELGLMENGKLVIIPRGKNGEMTLEQLDNIKDTVEWFFSGNWIQEKIREVEEPDVFELIKEECELENVRC
jgi:hypothetical protein